MVDQSVQHESDFRPDSQGYELPELLGTINDELAAGLRDGDGAHRVVQKETEREDIGRHICVELAGRQLAIPMASVLEAGEVLQVQALPLLPQWLSGITNIRGEIVSVVNLALFLDSGKTAPAGSGAFLLVHAEDLKTALAVDRIVTTRSLYRPFTEQGGQEGREALSDYCKPMAMYEEDDGDREIRPLDLDSFFSSEKFRDLTRL